MAWLRALPVRPCNGSVGGESCAAGVDLDVPAGYIELGEQSDGRACWAWRASHRWRPAPSRAIAGSSCEAFGDLPRQGWDALLRSWLSAAESVVRRLGYRFRSMSSSRGILISVS